MRLTRTTFALTIAAALLTAAGCYPARKPAEKSKKSAEVDPYKIEYKLTPILVHYADANPAQVVQVTEEALRALRVKLNRSTTTNIDGKFEGFTAMGRELHVHVIGQSPRQTLIRILAMDKQADLPSANIVMTEIVERLRTQSYTMYSERH